MSLFGKLLGEVVGGVIDTVDIGIGVVKDVAKIPVRLFDTSEGDSPDFLEDTKEVIEEIKSK